MFSSQHLDYYCKAYTSYYTAFNHNLNPKSLHIKLPGTSKKEKEKKEPSNSWLERDEGKTGCEVVYTLSSPSQQVILYSYECAHRQTVNATTLDSINKQTINK